MTARRLAEGERPPAPRRTRRRTRRRIGVAVGSLVLGLPLTLGVTSAAFSSTSGSAGNSLATGTVSLTDSRGGTSGGAVGTALWSSSPGLVPGSTESRCIRVTYGGSLAAQVRMYVATGDLTGNLGPYLRVSIDEATTGTAADCSDFAGGVTNLYNSGDLDDATTLATLASSATDFTSGLGAWAPSGAGDARTYRITWTVLADNASRGFSATVAFSWEARGA